MDSADRIGEGIYAHIYAASEKAQQAFYGKRGDRRGNAGFHSWLCLFASEVVRLHAEMAGRGVFRH